VILYNNQSKLFLFTSADNVVLRAFAAACRQCNNRLISPGRRRRKQQQTQSSRMQMTGQTDGRTPDSCIDPDPHTMPAVPKALLAT